MILSTAARRVLPVLLVAASLVPFAAEAASAATITRITGVQFSYDKYSGFQLQLDITGTGFGKKAPTSYPISSTRCGQDAATDESNGVTYGDNLWFLDARLNWSAGRGTTAKPETCVGVQLLEWSNTSVSIWLSYYVCMGEWSGCVPAYPGDNFVVKVKGAYWGGLVPDLLSYEDAQAGPRAAAATARITNVSFSGTTVTVTGSGFGSKAPTSYLVTGACGDPSYGDPTLNGKLYGNNLWFLDNTQYWFAGSGTATKGACLGLKLVSWSSTKVVFDQGLVCDGCFYSPPEAGDNFVLKVKDAYWGGVVS